MSKLQETEINPQYLSKMMVALKEQKNNILLHFKAWAPFCIPNDYSIDIILQGLFYIYASKNANSAQEGPTQ